MPFPRILFAALSLGFAHLCAANPVSTENVTARLVAESTVIVPGEPVELALVLDIRPGWHTYWENPGDSGEPTRIEWRLPEGVAAGPIRWPHPELIRVGPLANYGYSGRAVHLVTLTTPADWPVGTPLAISAQANWLVCEEHCIPERADLVLTLPTSAQGLGPDPGVRELFGAARERLPQPLEGTSELRVSEDGSLRLVVPMPEPPEAWAKVWFFPEHWGLVDHAADQPSRTDARSLLVDLAPGAAADQTPTEGVLVAETGQVTRAYALTPRRVAVPGGVESPAGEPGLGLPLALAFALLGGLILNLMPCVFPVLAMKALALVGDGDGSARHRALHGLAYTAGVLGFFALVAILLLGLRAGGSALGWGFQLQYPPFVALMAYVFLVLGLSLAGAVTLGSRLMGLGAGTSGMGIRGAFVTGGLAALVAAPCTAPFMGAALGYAVTLPWHLALAVVLTLGLGLALPYLLLCLIPSARKLLPKAGSWMEDLKQFLAFPMFATAAWLVWVLSVQVGPPAVASVLGGMVLIALGLWTWEHVRMKTGRVRLLAGAFAVSSLAAGLALGLGVAHSSNPAVGARDAAKAAGGALEAEGYSPQALDAARAAGRPVFVNMTAAWCITCLVNERVALSSAAVADAFGSNGLLYLKGDWTNRDPLITAYLEGFGRNGVPLYVYYPPGGEPRVLPQVLTPSIVLAAIGGDDPGADR